ncbi:STAS domain-containing protein, partial [bacterium]|nr:STAS domain-containing protein [bacterium]
GILIKVGIDILDYRLLEVWNNIPRNDLAVMISVFLVTVFVDLITAVGVGIVMASLLIVYRITKETQIVLDNESNAEGSYALQDKQTRIIKITGAFFFGSSTVFESRINSILNTKTIIIDIVDVPFIDLTAIFSLENLIIKLQKDDIKVMIVSKEKHKNKLMKLNKTHIFDGVSFYNNIDDAVNSI